MKRIQEKVKDLIDVRPYEVLQDFVSDPAQTLSIYHFTDITADLMAQWLNRVVNVAAGNGASSALAGYRGVGKSHFLATLGAIISHPELRSRISDAHVAASAQRLKRRRHPVAYVRRGIFDSFYDELRAAIAKVIDVDITPVESLSELLTLAAESADDVPFVLIIDTAFERAARVSRDDGIILGEIAEIAKDLNMFVGVALDDDIAGADGANIAITKTYSIDYLDQEHLYKIVNTYIFPKHRQALPILHEIYNEFRSLLPSFRWSEQRFASLYPLHPITLEIAPYVRLYAQDFALLSFTANAGDRIMGRPANSLIALDEVFDSVEASLRKVGDLIDAFTTYDRLNAEVVAQIPIMQRMKAKLILKGLLLLSLDGYGTTVSEISAAMLIFDEDAPEKSIEEVRNLLETFVSTLPESTDKLEEDGRETRYSLKISNKDDLNKTLTDAVKNISAAVIPKILRRVGRDKFPEWVLPEEGESQRGDITDCHAIWRGGLRRGKVVWGLESDYSEESPLLESADVYDWEVVVSENASNEHDANSVSRVYWRPAKLRKDEAETILRYFVLLTNTKLRDEYGELWQVAGHTHTVNVEKIWQRIFVQEASFVIDEIEYSIPDEASMTLTLSELISKMLEPLFEARYPNHPEFAKPLQMSEVSTLVKDFFSGAKQTGTDIQELLQVYAQPLSLVALNGESLVNQTEENILALPIVQEVMSLLVANPDSSISLKVVSQQLRQSPFGLMREAQYLVLSALVANRQIEFVTSKGDRINRRSLDLNIIWDDIVGIAKPVGAAYGNKRLIDWARLLTGAENLRSIDSGADKELISSAFELWKSEWESKKILSRFDELPDEILNTQIWRIATNSKKTTGAVASSIREMLAGTIDFEEGLLRIADAYSDSEKVFNTCQNDLEILEGFVDIVEQRSEISIYLSVCGPTENTEIEQVREKLIRVLDSIYFNPDQKSRSEMENLWERFHSQFTEYFAVNHDAVMKSHLLQEKYDEIRRNDDWWEFDNLSAINVFPTDHLKQINELNRQFKELNCRFNVKEMLKTHPFCACSFTLAKADEWERLPLTLVEKLAEARMSYRKILRGLSAVLVPQIEEMIQKQREDEFSTSALALINFLNGAPEIVPFDPIQLMILRNIIVSMPKSSMSGIPSSGEDSRFQADQSFSDLNVLNL